MKKTIIVLCMLLAAHSLSADDFDRLYKFMGDNNLKGFEAALKTKADANAAASNEYSLLMYAAMMKRKDFAAVLVARGAAVNYTTKNGQTALTMSADGGDIDMVRFFFEKGAECDGPGMKSVLPSLAAREKSNDGHIKVIELFLSRGVPVDQRNVSGDTALIAASERGNIQLVKYLLSNGADPNAATRIDQTALMRAANRTTKARIEVLRALVGAGAKVNARSSERCANPQFRNATPIMYALCTAEGGTAMIECVKFFIQAKADLSVKNGQGKTALGLAEERKDSDRAYPEVIRILREAGAKD